MKCRCPQLQYKCTSYSVKIPLWRCCHEVFPAATAFLNAELPKPSLAAFNQSKLLLIAAEICLPILTLSSSLPDRASDTLLLIKLSEDLTEQHQSKPVWMSFSKKGTAAKTLRILMLTGEICTDKRHREEAVELRQAPKSVKPCYPKEKINVLPSEWARCSTQCSHTCESQKWGAN